MDMEYYVDVDVIGTHKTQNSSYKTLTDLF